MLNFTPNFLNVRLLKSGEGDGPVWTASLNGIYGAVRSSGTARRYGYLSSSGGPQGVSGVSSTKSSGSLSSLASPSNCSSPESDSTSAIQITSFRAGLADFFIHQSAF